MDRPGRRSLSPRAGAEVSAAATVTLPASILSATCPAHGALVAQVEGETERSGVTRCPKCGRKVVWTVTGRALKAFSWRLAIDIAFGRVKR